MKLFIKLSGLTTIYYVLVFSRPVCKREPGGAQYATVVYSGHQSCELKNVPLSEEVVYFSHLKVEKNHAAALKSGRESATEGRHSASHLGFSLQVVPVETPANTQSNG